MPLTVPITGDLLLLKYMLNNQAPADVQMRLYNNNITPHESSEMADFTESVAASPYTAVTLTGASWVCTSGATAGATATYAQQNFNFSTADTIYGYFITSGGARTMLWAERFTGGPFQLPVSGGTIAITPKISLD
jgi:hypothetical protein